jgi:hypothetical protein
VNKGVWRALSSFASLTRDTPLDHPTSPGATREPAVGSAQVMSGKLDAQDLVASPDHLATPPIVG